MAIHPTSPTVADDELAAVVAELQAEYLASMPGRLTELRMALDRAIEDSVARVTVQRAGHRIAGTAATIGLPEVGDVGRAIELHAKCSGWTVAEVSALGAAVEFLAELTERAASGRPLPVPGSDPRVMALQGTLS